MNLPCLLAAPTLIRSAGGPLLVSPLTLDDFAFLLRACGDDLNRDADAGQPVEFGEEAAVDWLFGDGLSLLLWRALRRERPDLSIADADALASQLDADTTARVYRAAMRRDQSATPEEGEGRDIARLSWARIAYRYFEEGGILPTQLGGLTLDQMHAIASRGDDGNPDAVNPADVQAMYEAAMAEPVEPVKDEVTLADLGLEIVPGQEGVNDERTSEHGSGGGGTTRGGVGSDVDRNGGGIR